MGPKVEDVPELIQHIQSWLPVKEAARTSFVSKSWLHAWSTNPSLRFSFLRQKQLKLVDVERTLIRYFRDNIPIERFDLTIDLNNQESASYVKNWIGSVATKTCLKESFLSIGMRHFGESFMLPDEILSGQSLTKLTVEVMKGTHLVWMTTSHHPIINCLSLQELNLKCVCISEEVLDGILSSCRLLVKIDLSYSCKGFKTIKIKNLPRLYNLQIALEALNSNSTCLEISDVPNLGVFSYHLGGFRGSRHHRPLPLNAHSISLGSTVTQLVLDGLVTDNTSLDMITSKLPFLVILILDMTSWMLGCFHFTCASIKRLSLLFCPHMLTDVQVFAPKLTFFEFSGDILPSLLFSASPPKQIRVSLSLNLPVDANFFLRMRETLMLSSTFYLDITTDESKLPVDVDDLRTRLLFPPARNVRQLLFQTEKDECLWERSAFFDAFFEVCHPKHVCAKPDVFLTDNNHFCRLMVKEVLEKKTETTYWAHYLKDVLIREDTIWETLTNSHRSFLDGSAPHVYKYFKLRWR